MNRDTSIAGEFALQEIFEAEWDVSVIGAGLGGGVLGRKLAEDGKKVLFLEAGHSGKRTEAQKLSTEIHDPKARRIRGYWPTALNGKIDGVSQRFFAPIGSGAGGSSVFYAGALERPSRHDLEGTDEMPHPTMGWPVGYDDFSIYFKHIEEIFYLSGTRDPLSEKVEHSLLEPAGISRGEAAMMASFEEGGLHPYRLHLAIRNVEGCRNCVGYKCPKNCKMDGRSAGVEPALNTGNATLFSNCEVTRIDWTDGKVNHVDILHNEKTYSLSARKYVLAAGALNSPRLLFLSANENGDVPANSSDWVGRGLMFHVNELFAIWPKRKDRFEGASKSISLRDFYSHKGKRLGMIQSLGMEADFGNVLLYLKNLYDKSPLRRFSKLQKLLAFPAAVAVRMFGNAKIFVGILEDLPYPENRVVLNPEEPEITSFEYSISDELKERGNIFRKLIRKSFKGHRKMFFSNAPELNFGHPSGTLRFGSDPKNSVLNAECRTHDLENLFVADASFMPTSMGVNPSLTIAANALRVADIISQEIDSEKS